MANSETVAIVLDDGRRAERRTTVADDGTETIEVYAEAERPMHLVDRVTKKKSLVVTEETHETADETGAVVASTTQRIDPPHPVRTDGYDADVVRRAVRDVMAELHDAAESVPPRVETAVLEAATRTDSDGAGWIVGLACLVFVVQMVVTGYFIFF